MLQTGKGKNVLRADFRRMGTPPNKTKCNRLLGTYDIFCFHIYYVNDLIFSYINTFAY